MQKKLYLRGLETTETNWIKNYKIFFDYYRNAAVFFIIIGMQHDGVIPSAKNWKNNRFYGIPFVKLSPVLPNGMSVFGIVNRAGDVEASLVNE